MMKWTESLVSMKWTEWLLGAVFAVPAVALVAWFWLLTVEMKDEKEKKMRSRNPHKKKQH
jgi:hypothetical protein